MSCAAWVKRPDAPGEWYKKLANGSVVEVTIVALDDELFERGADRLWAVKDGEYKVKF